MLSYNISKYRLKTPVAEFNARKDAGFDNNNNCQWHAWLKTATILITKRLIECKRALVIVSKFRF